MKYFKNFSILIYVFLGIQKLKIYCAANFNYSNFKVLLFKNLLLKKS